MYNIKLLLIVTSPFQIVLDKEPAGGFNIPRDYRAGFFQKNKLSAPFTSTKR